MSWPTHWTHIDVLRNSTINGERVCLPDVAIDKELFEQVKTYLSALGGKWKGEHLNAFAFKSIPPEIVEMVNSKNRRLLSMTVVNNDGSVGAKAETHSSHCALCGSTKEKAE